MTQFEKVALGGSYTDRKETDDEDRVNITISSSKGELFTNRYSHPHDEGDKKPTDQVGSNF